MVKIRVGEESQITAAAEGNGPVNALDLALRGALHPFLSVSLAQARLTDYKVRVMESDDCYRRQRPGTHRIHRRGTAPGRRSAYPHDIIEASLTWPCRDSIEYKLAMDEDRQA